MFDLKRPCSSCPFRKGQGELFRLPAERLQEIFEATSFQCHKTVDYSCFDDPIGRQGEKPQQCAGLITVLRNEGKANQITQLAERLQGYDSSALDPNHECYASIDEALRAHAGIPKRLVPRHRKRDRAMSTDAPEVESDQAGGEKQESTAANRMPFHQRVAIADYVRALRAPIVAQSKSEAAKILANALNFDITWGQLKYIIEQLPEHNLAAKFVFGDEADKNLTLRVVALEEQVRKLQEAVAALSTPK